MFCLNATLQKRRLPCESLLLHNKFKKKKNHLQGNVTVSSLLLHSPERESHRMSSL